MDQHIHNISLVVAEVLGYLLVLEDLVLAVVVETQEYLHLIEQHLE